MALLNPMHPFCGNVQTVSWWQARNLGNQSVESDEHGEVRQERLRQRFTQPGYGNYGGYSYGGSLVAVVFQLKMMITESLVQAEKGRRAKAKVAPRLHFEDPNWSW